MNTYLISFEIESMTSENMLLDIAKREISYTALMDAHYFKIIKKDGPPVFYPESVIREVEISFTSKVSKDAVESIIEYWASIPYNGELFAINWYDNTACVNIDFIKSKSGNYLDHKPLEQLHEFLTWGTPIRKDETRAHYGLGKIVNKIVGRDDVS